MNDRTKAALVPGIAMTVMAVPIAVALKYQPASHRCDAPCTVRMPQGTQEDQVAWDFHHQRVTVRFRKEGP